MQHRGPTPLISAIVCAHNRAQDLSQVLESLRAQTLPWVDFETIVVDNCLGDETEQVARKHVHLLPNLSYVQDDALCLSGARNTGAFYANSPYVAYLDDDARADPRWLESLLTTFTSVRPKPAVVGGRIWLNWGGDTPSWLDKRYWPLYSHLDLGDTARFLDQDEVLIGTNMAFDWETLLGLGGFPTELGWRNENLLSGEETALLRTIRDRCLPIYYQPSAIVWHAVPKECLSRRWFLGRVFWDGASQLILDDGIVGSRRYRIGRACRDLRQMARHLARMPLAVLKRDRKAFMHSLVSSVQRLGRLQAGLRLAMRRAE